MLLLKEIVLNIVEFLKDDRATLHSCILVNREWCKIVIPILWNDTFRRLKPFNNNGQSIEGKQIISTYTKLLSEESRNLLKKYGIKLVNNRKKPLFNYSEFLRHLDAYYLKVYVRSWFYFTTRDDMDIARKNYKTEQVQVMSFVLLNHFLEQTPCLISLKVASTDITEAIIKALIDNPQAGRCLSNLKSFKQHYNVHPVSTNLFSQLSGHAWNIQNIDVAIQTEISELSTLIFNQKNLKRLTIRNKNVVFGSRMCKNYALSNKIKEIAPAISHQSTSMTHLKLESIKFPLGSLNQFKNLIELELKLCGYNQEDLNTFTQISLDNLEIFIFESKYPIYLKSFVDLIRNSGKNLRKLTLHGCQIEDPENAQKLIISLTKFSPNLVYYDGPILKDNTFELETMLDQCTQLHTLLLHPSISRCYSPIPSIDFDPLFNIIAHNKSHKLKNLSIIHAWKISEDALLDFFETHKKKNIGPIQFNYEKDCTVFPGISTICSKYNDFGVGLDCKITYYPKYYYH
ncbi:hypothetical protein RclHR1_10750003 [Rhizophagus clarus]|uniref:F-box domain-containing protein n=1 Tax=Rhizophagus clarus TaxID=94130 RepID=A0A2Z6QH41_9GLOM|nr:hypothetical protein RclHR1_10750003 [Rhizophagus clarus]GES91966.1 hypothetical protein GLOIN_2v1523507 [Rhizophagus clarus]